MKQKDVNDNNEQVPDTETYNVDDESTLSLEAQERTTEARSLLYNLIVRFRKDAAKTDDKEAKSVFEFAAEIIAGLTRGFRKFQERRSSTPSGDKEADSTHE